MAAKRAFKSVECAGIDKDRVAIQRLRRRHPDWHLSVADVLNPRTHQRAQVLDASVGCDLLALNPPFSMERKKSVCVEFRGKSFRSSVAMAHILRSAELFVPTEGAIAIVPESLLFSDVDDVARRELNTVYRLRVVAELRNTTFRGARANAMIVRLTSRPSGRGRTQSTRRLTGVQLVRGGLPVFESHRSRAGVPYLHSTDITRVATTGSLAGCKRVVPIDRGLVSGTVILLPRVGLPTREAVKPVYLRSTVQLSDCVIALKFASTDVATKRASSLAARWDELVSLYRGTGARYVTTRRLEDWLAAMNA